MKYGPIICNPRSEEAKALIGKKVVASYMYAFLDMHPDMCTPYELTSITEKSDPFVANGANWIFIREVIEEEPQYRPYKDTEEMLEDYKARFHRGINWNPATLPPVWLQFGEPKSSYLVTMFSEEHIKVFRVLERMDEVFKNYTYLDGSPVGKEVEE